MPILGRKAPVDMGGISFGGVPLGGTRRDVDAVPPSQNIIEGFNPIQKWSMDGMKGVAIHWEWLRAVLRIEARDVDVVLSRYVAEHFPDFDLCLGGTLSRDLFVVSLLDDVGKPIQGRLYPGMELSQSLVSARPRYPHSETLMPLG